ncbi:hypothetical protein HLB23_35450 [Nocardia uniformis]|uniref:DUF8020 domain-containing protein n=1 Tax=Nocardia uniformis TaxID=53432 RepID=A0A849CBJ9_9NOCA|nr:hypothetical protein [Nocardia uniformis]NNH75088.1 hypothetical protein [Nocardia uniformis]
MSLRTAALTMLVLGSTVAAAGTVHAESDSAAGESPAEMVSSVRGTANGVGYSATITPDGRGVATTLDAGSFALTPDAAAVTIADRDGAVVAAVPLSFQVADHWIAVAPSIANQGTTLTLEPVHAMPLRDVSARENWDAQVQRGVFGALIGGTIGGLVTLPFWIFVLPPLLGIAIGAGIGFLAAGGQPLIDAGIAYFSGQP